jgi:hypothetical protein
MGGCGIMATYRIYTEDKNREEVEKIVSSSFDGFTIYETTGYYKNVKEKSIVIEVIDRSLVADSRVKNIAARIKTLNSQEVVLVTICETHEYEVYIGGIYDWNESRVNKTKNEAILFAKEQIKKLL